MRPRPTFDELPPGPDPPFKSAWNLWNQKGKLDERGTLNLITPETVLRSKEEIVLGNVISLNLPLHLPVIPMNPARKPLRHQIIAKGPANDDEIILNTQASTHWDGLRHVPYQAKKQFYNDVSQDAISGAAPSDVIGVQNLAEKGIVGRGVLLDVWSWMQAQNRSYSAFKTFSITLDELKAVAESQHVTFLPADILIIRFGWVEQYLALSKEEQVALGGKESRAFVGVEQSMEMLRWHWENQFSAVAGDTNAYESWPPKLIDGIAGSSCHEVFLSGWGLPIGEMWDLEALSKACQAANRWTFFLTSQPLNISGGVASPANVMAIL